jgi:hypothetical protein
VRYDQDVRELFPRTRFEGVVVCAGFAPRVELAREAGLATARTMARGAHRAARRRAMATAAVHADGQNSRLAARSCSSTECSGSRLASREKRR